MIGKQIYILHSKEGVHLISSNLLVIYQCLREYEKQIVHANLRSYSWYCAHLNINKDVAIPKQGGGAFIISRRPMLSKWIPNIETHCHVDFDI